MAEEHELGLLEGLATTRAIRRYLPEPSSCSSAIVSLPASRRVAQRH